MSKIAFGDTDAPFASKVCTGCGLDKPLSAFHKRPERPIGVKPQCRSCANSMRKSHYERAKKDGSLKNALWKRDGIEMNFVEYSKKYAALQGRCEICGDQHEVLCVDHNHATGKIRGLLCTQCNLAISHLKESPKIMQNAIAYIENYGGLNV